MPLALVTSSEPGPAGCDIARIAGRTVTLAGWLVVMPQEFARTTSYAATSPGVEVGTDSVDPVAPGIAAPFRRHWRVTGEEPTACTDSVTAAPGSTVCIAGCPRIRGGPPDVHFAIPADTRP